MAPLIIQLVSYAVLFLLRMQAPEVSWLQFTLRAEAICIGVMFIATGVAHFTSLESMKAMFPRFVTYKTFLVYVSGVFEIVAGAALVFGLGPQALIGLGLLLFLIASLPLNIYSAWNEVGMSGRGVRYLWFRIPLQIFWFGWIYYFIVESLDSGHLF